MSSAILITGRLKSTRLKNKALRPMLGIPMIGWLINNLKSTQLKDNIHLITSELEDDDELVRYAASTGIGVYRGEPIDVLLRIYKAAVKLNLKTVVSCTADNPLVLPDMVDKLVQHHEKNNNDFTSCMGLPFGTFAYAIKVDALKTIIMNKVEDDTEIWGSYFTHNDIFKCQDMNIPIENKYTKTRLTVDTVEDFVVVQEVINQLQVAGEGVSIESLLKVIGSNADLFKLNEKIIQKKAPIYNCMKIERK